MSINARRKATTVGLALLALALGCSALTAQAQLSPPLAGGFSMGSGPGYHGPNSPFAPLPERSDVLPWSVLTAVKTKVVKNRILPIFTSDIAALSKQSQRVQGFMMPLEPGEKQKHFLLSAVPLTCPFCVPGGPESMVEVKTKTPVRYTMEPVVVEGPFSVLTDDPQGLYYRMIDAVAVK